VATDEGVADKAPAAAEAPVEDKVSVKPRRNRKRA